MPKYRLFQQVHCYIDGLGLGRGTVSQVRSTYCCEQGFPMGKPVYVNDYEVQVEGVGYSWLSEDMVDLSKARLEKRVNDAKS